jgi:hypothetical protein
VITGSLSVIVFAHPSVCPFAKTSNFGLSIEGIPSLGGPPDLISSKETECREKSVSGHSLAHCRVSAVAANSPGDRRLAIGNSSIAIVRRIRR